jgi:hypothetical protein
MGYILSNLIIKSPKQVRGLLRHFVTNLFFYCEELLAPRSTPQLENHPLSAVRECLFNIFVATFHIWRPSPPSATWGGAMPWWQGTHVTWISLIIQLNYLRDKRVVLWVCVCYSNGLKAVTKGIILPLHRSNPGVPARRRIYFRLH